MVYRYKTKGTCSVCIDVEMEGNTLKNAVFHGGCNGNLQGLNFISTLVAELFNKTLPGLPTENRVLILSPKDSIPFIYISDGPPSAEDPGFADEY